MQTTRVVASAFSICLLFTSVACGSEASFDDGWEDEDFDATGAKKNDDVSVAEPEPDSFGGSTHTGDPQPAPIASVHELSYLWAQRWVKCAHGADRIAETGYGGVMGLADEYEANQKIRLGLSGVSLRQEQVDACVDRLRTAPCSVTFAECDFRGMLVEGVACLDGLQCASGECVGSAVTPVGGQTGTCGQCAPSRSVGQACTSSCDVGLGCQYGRCVTLAALGASCDDAPCGDRMHCGAAKTCVPNLPVGAACSGGDFEQCDAPLRCAEGTCIAQLPLKVVLPGGSCAEEAGVRVVCRGSTCHAPDATCITRVKPEAKPIPATCP